MRKGDYFNLARLLGKLHLEFVSASNSTLLRCAAYLCGSYCRDTSILDYPGPGVGRCANRSLFKLPCNLVQFAPNALQCTCRDSNGQLVDWNHVNFVGEVDVDIPALLPVVQAATMAACGPCYQPCGPINERGEEECVPEQAVP